MGNYSLKNIFLGVGIGLIIASMVNISMGSSELTVEEIKQEAQKHGLIVLSKEEIMADQPPADEPAPTATPSPAPPPAAQGEKITITVESGMSSEDITNLLDAAGLLKDRKAFIQRLGELGMDSRLRVGTFEIAKGTENDEIIRILTSAF